MLASFAIFLKNGVIEEQTSCILGKEEKKVNKDGSKIFIQTYRTKNGEMQIRNVSVLYDGVDVIEKWIEIENISHGNVTIERVDSAKGILPAPDFPSHKHHLKYFESDAGQEFIPADIELTESLILQVTSGRSSKGMHPWFYLEDSSGAVLSASVAWSGNWIIRFEKQQNGAFEISAGINDKDFHKTLKPNEKYESVHVIYTYMQNGTFDDACIQFQKWGRKYAYPGNELSMLMPVEWNHWWPYEDVEINEEVFKKNVDECEKLGIEVCTLDAGWFGEPDENCNADKSGWSENVDWYVKRGDWHKVNTIRFPSGIPDLSEYVHSKGLKFGIWCEIEAVGAKADLAKLHPEYLALRDGSRLGYVCMGNPEAVEWACGVLKKLIEEYKADWIKLDFNLDPKSGCNRTDHGHDEGDGLAAHYEGYYRLLTYIRSNYPHVLLENCSSGGLRIDLNMAKHTHCSYLSDPDHTVHHLQVFWGVSTMLHPSAALHFTWSQNRVFYESNLDKDPIKEDMPLYKFDYIMRAGMLGRFALSYRLTDLPEWCKERIKYHVSFYKQNVREFMKISDMHHLTGQALRTGGGDRWNAFLYVNEQKTQALAFVFRLPGAEAKRVIYFRGLDPDRLYHVTHIDSGLAYKKTGKELAEQGVVFENMPEESSEIIIIS